MVTLISEWVTATDNNHNHVPTFALDAQSEHEANNRRCVNDSQSNVAAQSSSFYQEYPVQFWKIHRHIIDDLAKRLPASIRKYWPWNW